MSKERVGRLSLRFGKYNSTVAVVVVVVDVIQSGGNSCFVVLCII